MFADASGSKESCALNSEVDQSVRSNSVGPSTNDSSLFLGDAGNLLRTARKSSDTKGRVLFGTSSSSGNGDGGRGGKSAKVKGLNGDGVDSGGF